MKWRALAIVGVLIFVFVTSVFVSAVEGATYRDPPVSKVIWTMATKVAVCEEGGWSKSSNQHGPTYFGNLGWLDSTWQEFKRPSFPSRMDHATPVEQAIAMARFAGRYYWPDQNGCSGGY